MTVCGARGRPAVPDPLYDGDPELRAEAETLRQDHRQTEAVGKSNGHDREPISVDDFYAYMPMHKYIFSPTRALWPGASVNARIPPIKLSDRNGDPVLEARRRRFQFLSPARNRAGRPRKGWTLARSRKVHISRGGGAYR